MCCTVSSAARSRMATNAPACANAIAIACPMRDPPPVTMATRPWSDSDGSGESAAGMATEIVAARGVTGTKCFLFRSWPVGRQLVHDVAPERFPSGERDDGPVAPVENAVGAKAGTHVLHVRPKGVGVTLIGPRLREQPRDLAGHAGVRRHALDGGGPRRERVVPDGRLAAVVEHDVHSIALFHERQRFVEL